MSERENKKSSLSQSTSYEEMAAFWDTHSLADFEDETYEVEIEFDASAGSNSIHIELELLNDLRKVARKRHVSTQTLVNLWLRERLATG
jgi:hypothetical protein